MVLCKKNADLGSGFSENPEKTILAGNYKIFLQKSSNIHVKNRWNDSDNNDKWATLQIQ